MLLGIVASVGIIGGMEEGGIVLERVEGESIWSKVGEGISKRDGWGIEEISGGIVLTLKGLGRKKLERKL